MLACNVFHFIRDLSFTLFFCQQLADVWEQKLGEEQEKTGPLEQVCAALREDLDTQHKKRMEALEIKMKPIIIKDGPSKKVKKNLNLGCISGILSHVLT
jgi:hypothetical protein